MGSDSMAPFIETFPESVPSYAAAIHADITASGRNRHLPCRMIRWPGRYQNLRLSASQTVMRQICGPVFPDYHAEFG